MAIKVNTTAISKEGLIIPSGYLIGFDVIFPDGKSEIHFNPKVYISEQARTDGKSKVFPEFISKLSYVYSPTVDEFSSLNPVSVNTFYKDYLESLEEIGAGNTEIIL